MTAKYMVDPSLWNSVISVAVGNVGELLVDSGFSRGGYGTGYGGTTGGFFSMRDYGSGGGGGSSVEVGVSV